MKYTLFEKVLVQYKAIKTLFDFNKFQYDTMVTTENENALQQIISHNFRLGWIFSKLLEIHVCTHLTNYLRAYKLIVSTQSGFRSQHSTESIPLKMTDD